MTVEELANLVANMRHSQGEYFRTRSQTALEQSKWLEQKVDRCVGILLNKQKEMFDE